MSNTSKDRSEFKGKKCGHVITFRSNSLIGSPSIIVPLQLGRFRKDDGGQDDEEIRWLHARFILNMLYGTILLFLYFPLPRDFFLFGLLVRDVRSHQMPYVICTNTSDCQLLHRRTVFGAFVREGKSECLFAKEIILHTKCSILYTRHLPVT